MIVLSRRALAPLALVPLLRPASAETTTETARVTIDNFVFNPPEITVRVGTTVTWTNQDDIPHTVVGKERGFRSNALDTDDSFSFVFTSPGRFEYFCSLHPHMVGTIVVA